MVVSFDKLEQLCSVSVRDRNILSSTSLRLYVAMKIIIQWITKHHKEGDCRLDVKEAFKNSVAVHNFFERFSYIDVKAVLPRIILTEKEKV